MTGGVCRSSDEYCPVDNTLWMWEELRLLTLLCPQAVFRPALRWDGERSEFALLCPWGGGPTATTCQSGDTGPVGVPTGAAVPVCGCRVCAVEGEGACRRCHGVRVDGLGDLSVSP